MSEKSVAEQVQELTQRWNPSPVEHSIERLVGTAVPEGDTRATGHVPMEELNRGFNPADDSVDAQRQYADDGDDSLPEVPTDDDGDPDYSAMTVDDLKQHLSSRDLAVSGNKDELVKRLEDDDEG